jgi:flagellar biosynthesis protein FliR
MWLPALLPPIAFALSTSIALGMMNSMTPTLNNAPASEPFGGKNIL